MIASGWQTAPPQVIEVVSATNSVALQSLEASHRPDLQGFTTYRSARSRFSSQHRPAVALAGVLHAASASRRPSAHAVSST